MIIRISWTLLHYYWFISFSDKQHKLMRLCPLYFNINRLDMTSYNKKELKRALESYMKRCRFICWFSLGKTLKWSHCLHDNSSCWPVERVRVGQSEMWDVWLCSDQIWQMSEHWSHECHEECHDVCHVPSAQAKTSVFLIRSQVVNKEKPKSSFYLQKVETIFEIKDKGCLCFCV